MARIGINTGATANDGTGDTLRAGAAKVNDNFSELYTFLGDGSNLTAVIGSGIATAGGTVGTGATILDFRGSGISTNNTEPNHIAFEVMQSNSSGAEQAVIATWLIEDAFIGNNLTNALISVALVLAGQYLLYVGTPFAT